MSFFDAFWVPLDYRIPREYLVVISGFEGLLIVTFFIIYNRIRSNIKKSLLGPAHDTELKIQLIIAESLRTIFMGLILLVLANLVSHISGFFDSYCPYITDKAYESCYLFVGQEDFIQLIGIIFLVIGVFNLSEEIVRPEDQKTMKFKTYPSIFVILISLVIFGFLNHERSFTELQLELTIPLLIYISIYVYLFLKILKSTRRKFESPLINIRKKMVFILYNSIVILQLIIVALFWPKNGMYPTRTINVEFYFLLFNIYAILIASQVFFIIRLPMFILKLNGVTLKDKLRYADFRFDNPITIDQEILFLRNKSSKVYIPNYLLTYDKDEALLCKMLFDFYEAYTIRITQLNEETLLNFHLPNVDMILFVSKYSKLSDKYFKDIQSTYFLSYHYDYENNTVNSASHKFISEDHKYALLTVSPSFWNSHRNIIIVNFIPKLTNVIYEFFKDFKEYIDNLFAQNPIIQIVLRFPEVNDNISKIPAISPTISFPDQKYIEILG